MSKRRKVFAILLVAAVFVGCLPASQSRANTYVLDCETEKGTFRVNTADEAVDILERDHGGTIIVVGRVEWTTDKVRTLTENMKILVPADTYLRIDGPGIDGNGQIEVYGTLDLKESTCTTFHMGAGIIKKNRGEVLAPVATVGTLDVDSDIAATIYYGQTLPDEDINDHLIGKRMYVPGKWQFRDQTTRFPVGIHPAEVYFDYERTAYYPFSVTENLQIEVKKATPEMISYQMPDLQIGAKLSTLQPQYDFQNPYTKETVTGTLSYVDASATFNSMGEKNLKAVFTPDDRESYETQELTLKVNVVRAEPKIVSLPSTGTGKYGGTLADISIEKVSAVDSFSGAEVKGGWAWKNKESALETGTHNYTAVFTPEDLTFYSPVEAEVPVVTAPQKKTLVEWPSVSVMKEGQHLFEAELSFESNEYGVYRWEDETEIPSIEYKGAILLFVPFDTENYDWSFVSGYDQTEKTIKKTVPLQIEGGSNAGGASGASPTAVPTKTPTPTESAEESQAAVPTKTPAPTESAEESQAAVPTKTPTPTESAGESQAAVPTKTPAPTKTPDSASEEEDPVVIKTMISKISTIKTPKAAAVTKKRLTVIRALRNGEKAIIKVGKVKKAVYQVRYGLKKKLKKAKKKKFSHRRFVIKKLNKGKKYYFQVRAIKEADGKKYYGKWSVLRQI